ncbi:response regulator [Schlesneria paludicola]|uniref:response regulator n=1 Tax=Schlesneria paludicola TaxID=360056 RepID=UPI00029B1E2F|nr:response regulator [Schlesneria paludicola]
MFVEQYQLLIADDDDAFRGALCEIFEPFFRLIEAQSGEEALELASREDVHLALFDMHMHRLTGLEALRQLKEIHIVAPCILITADYTSELCDDAAEAHVFTVLKKPVTKHDLVRTVATAVDAVYHDRELSGRLLST